MARSGKRTTDSSWGGGSCSPAGPCHGLRIVSMSGWVEGRGERGPHALDLACLDVFTRTQKRPARPRHLGPQPCRTVPACSPGHIPALAPSVLRTTTTPDLNPRVAGSVLCLHFPAGGPQLGRPEPGLRLWGTRPPGAPGTWSVIQAKALAISLSLLLRLPGCCPRIGAPRLLRTHPWVLCPVVCPLLHSSFIWLSA